MTTSDAIADILEAHWQAWQHAFNQRDFDRIVVLFADDALFQGLSPNLLVGTAAIAEYYRNVPAGVTADVSPGKCVAAGPDSVAGFATVRFTRADGTPERIARLSVTLQRWDEQWRTVLFHACESVSLP